MTTFEGPFVSSGQPDTPGLAHTFPPRAVRALPQAARKPPRACNPNGPARRRAQKRQFRDGRLSQPAGGRVADHKRRECARPLGLTADRRAWKQRQIAGFPIG